MTNPRTDNAFNGWPLVAAATGLLFILPFTHTVALRLLLLAIALATTIGVLVRNPPLRRVIPGYLLLALGLWAALALASIGWSVDPERTNGEAVNETVYPALAFLIFTTLGAAPGAVRRWLATLAFSAICISGIAIWRHFQAGTWSLSPGIGVSDANAFSTYGAIALPLLAHAVGRPADFGLTPRLRWLAGAATPMLALATLLTLNRAVWIALTCAVIVYLGMLLLFQCRVPNNARVGRGRLIAVFAAVLIAGVGAMAALSAVKAQRHAPDGSSTTFLANDGRFQIWSYALSRIDERPLTGFGFGRGILREDMRAAANGNPLHWHSHNHLLDTYLGLGIPGVLVYLGLIIGVIVFFLRLARAPGQSPPYLAALALALLASMLVKNSFDHIVVRENSMLFWALLGLLVARCRETEDKGESPLAGSGGQVH